MSRKTFRAICLLSLVVIGGPLHAQGFMLNGPSPEIGFLIDGNGIGAFAGSRPGFTNRLTVQFFEEIRFLPASPSSFLIRTDNSASMLLGSETRFMRFLVDVEDTVASQGIFTWYQDGTGNADRLMQLNANDGGDLLIGGQLTQNTDFDVAVAFWSGGPLEPGEVVAVDPRRGDGVRRAADGDRATVLGVASERPAIVLGGGAFSADGLRRSWGDVIAEAFERERPELEIRALARSESLREEAERLASLGTWAAWVAAQAGDPEGNEAFDRAGAPVEEPSGLAADYENALQQHESVLFDASMRLFFSERFAPVAVAGRVSVRVDASFGAIAAGDPLTASPVPGVAMKATTAGPIFGFALEPLDAGSGRILTLVDRAWYPGESRSLAATDGDLATTRALLLARERQLEQLSDRLGALEARLGDRAPETGEDAGGGSDLDTRP